MSRVVRGFESGDYERRVEIGSLARAFNRMADTIHSHMKELRNADTLRRELVAGVSHDLKSPLATIQGYIETLLMKQGSLSREQERKFLDMVLKNTQFLDRLVGELLELSKLETKQVRPDPEVFSMTDLVQDVFMKFEPQAVKRDIHLTARMPGNLCFTRADIA